MKHVALFIIALALIAAAPDDTPRSPAAKVAQAKYDRSIREADAAYKKAKLAATRSLLDDLTAARDAVLKNGAAGLEEANRINALIETAKADMRALLGMEQTASRSIAEIITQQKVYHYGWLRSGDRAIEFLSNGKIGAGSGGWEQEWQIRRDGGQDVLVLSGGGKYVELHLIDGGAFVGYAPQADAKVVMFPGK